MIDNDFGDITPEQVAEQAECLIAGPWPLGLVRSIIKREAPFLEDLAQEARVEMWRAAGRWDGQGSLDGFLKQRARWRVWSLLNGDHRFTGDDGVRVPSVTQRRGDEARDRLRSAMATFRAEHRREPKAEEMAKVLGIHPATVRKQIRTLTLTKVDVELQVSSLDALVEVFGVDEALGVSDKIDSIVLAYHYGEIHKAVADLDPLWREYVYLRFWRGHGDTEVAQILGTRVHWHNRVRPALAERLSHLAGAL